MKESDEQLNEVLFEFVVHGRFVKVMAVDPITGTEVAIVGDIRAGKRTLEAVATKKLLFTLKKKKDQFKKNDDNNLY